MENMTWIEVVYWASAIIGGLLFMLRSVLFFIGMGHDGDIDGHFDGGDFHGDVSGGDFHGDFDGGDVHADFDGGDASGHLDGHHGEIKAPPLSHVWRYELICIQHAQESANYPHPHSRYRPP